MNRRNHAPQRGDRLLLAACLLLFFWLQIDRIEAFGFWVDEALTPLRAELGLGDLLRNVVYVQDAVSIDTHPPLYYLIMHATMGLWGRSDFALRFPSVLFNLLLLPVLFQLGRRLFDRRAGRIAAVLTAVNPLFIWYGQEARMYTLLLLLGALAAYVLWRALTEPAGLFRWLALYALLAGMMVYTHYVTVFLVAGQGLFWVWLLWRRGHGRLLLLLGGLAAAAAIPLVPYTIPRLFTGAETGYTYLPPWVMLRDMVTGFGMGVTPPLPAGLADALWWGLALSAGGGAYLLVRREPWLKTAFVLVYLLAVIAGIALVSPLKPMYQGVRHIMLGSPAFILLLAFAAGRLARRPRRLQAVLGGAAGLVALAAALGGVYRLKTDPLVAKDQFREAVRHIEARAGGRDAVVYNDAISMMIHTHYAERDDLRVVALPVYPLPAGPETAAALEGLAEEVDRIWFLPGLPNDGRDRGELVRGWFRENLVRVRQTPFFSRGTLLQVELYDTGRIVNPETAPAVPLELAPPDWPALAGLTVREITGGRLWLDLYVRATIPLAGRDLRLSLVGPDGYEWASVERPLWQGDPLALGPDDIARLPLDLDLPGGLAPGRYRLTLRRGSDGGQPFDPLDLTAVDLAASPEPEPAAAAAFENGLLLSEVEVIGREVRPGHVLPVFPVWWTDRKRPLSPLQVDLQVAGAGGRTIYETTRQLGVDWLAEWPAGTRLRQLVAVTIPPEAAPGLYALRWRLREGETAWAGRAGWWPFAGEWVQAGQVEVKGWPLITTPPPVQTRSGARFGEEVSLYGYDLEQTEETLAVDLVWQANAAPPVGYYTFVHLVDVETGIITRQRDWIPAEGLRPAAGWRPGEFIRDPHRLDLRGLPAGSYRVVAGLFDPVTFDRPLVTLDGREQPDRQLLLGQIDLK